MTLTDEQKEQIKEREAVVKLLDAPGRAVELWRVEHKQKAYRDQTGRQQSGDVVYERIVVTIAATFDQYEWYGNTWVENAGKIAVATDGRRFRGTANLVDYSGGTTWRDLSDVPPGHVVLGHWRTAPTNLAGYCYPDGSAPVERLT